MNNSDILTESLYGIKMKVLYSGQEFNALISKNTIPKELPFRFTWFAKKEKDIIPIEHHDISEKEVEFILKNNKFPKRVERKFGEWGVPEITSIDGKDVSSRNLDEELLNEELIGQRLYLIVKDSLGKEKLKVYALLSKNTSHAHIYSTGYRDKEYRLTWFDRTRSYPKGHIGIDKKVFNYILRTKKLTPEIKHQLSSAFFFPSSNIDVEFVDKFNENKISMLEIKSIIKEIIAEEKMFGERIHVKIKIKSGNIIFPALISNNIYYLTGKEGKYRITMFNPETMKPLNHFWFGKDFLDFILKNKRLPKQLEKLYGEIGLLNPELIFEVKRTGPLHPTGADILVGTIDKEDGYVDAKYGGTHKTMKVRNNPKGNWRFNDETRIVYWHSAHPHMYERYVDGYIENNLGIKVKQHLTLDNLASLPDVYQ